jgi:dTDP-glucose pyrophosphorylase
MKAVILAAGKGTRMKDLTQSVPKPMLRVQGKPILEHIVEGLILAGIKEFFIVTGWQAETIESYFGNGKKWGVTIQYGRQIVQDGTGKAPEIAQKFVGQSSFLLTYGDILVKPETYQRMLARFAEKKFDGLLTVTAGQDVTKGGILFFDESFTLSHLVEKPSHEQLRQLREQGILKEGAPVWYNAGIYVFGPDLYTYTCRLQKSPRGEYELTDAIIAMSHDHKQLAGLEIAGRWVDVRDPQTLEELEKATNF